MSDVERVAVREKPRMSLSDYEEKMQERNLTLDGSQLIPDPTPMQPPLGFKKQPSMVDHIRQMIRSENIRRAAEEAGAETFEEADDFDIPEGDELPGTRYEMEEVFEPPVAVEPASPANSDASVAPGATPTPAAPSGSLPEPSSSAPGSPSAST